MKGRKTGRSLLRSERRAGLAFIAPMYFQFFVFFVFFMGYSLVMSMTDWNILANTKRFIGFLNFHEVLSDPLFWKSLWNTLYLMLGIPIGMVLAMILALALNRKLPGKTVFRVIMYLPAVSSSVAIALLWRWIYNAEYGILNVVDSVAGMFGEAVDFDASCIDILCGGSPYGIAAFLFAQRQRGDKPCGVRDDCRNAALLPVRHV